MFWPPGYCVLQPRTAAAHWRAMASGAMARLPEGTTPRGVVKAMSPGVKLAGHTGSLNATFLTVIVP